MSIIKKLIFVLAITSIAPTLAAQEVINIWQGNIMPYHKESDIEEYQENCWEEKMCVFNVVKPTLTIYRAIGKNTGKAIIVLPGGGYQTEAITHEGYEVAEALSKKGITAAVLKYRLPNPKTSTKPELTPLSDVRESIRLLRAQKEQYGIESNKIGVLGFSAGSHLATIAGLWPSTVPSENPDFSLLIYGITTLNDENKKWLEHNMYFRPLTSEETKQNTLLNLVSKNTPPAFLVHAMNDDVCHYTESTLYAEARTKQGIDVETHLYAKGGHGFGLGRIEDGTIGWLNLSVEWVKRL